MSNGILLWSGDVCATVLLAKAAKRCFESAVSCQLCLCQFLRTCILQINDDDDDDDDDDTSVTIIRYSITAM